jgi:Phosphotransferase enzyme family
MSVLDGDARFLLPQEPYARILTRRRDAPAGYQTRAFAALPSPEQPVLFVPTDRANVAEYVLRMWTVPMTRFRAFRKDVLVRVARPVLARRAALVVASPVPGEPFVLAAAATRFALGADLDWFLLCGQGDELARCGFVVFPRDAKHPEWMVKFSRARGYADPFERDERASALVAAAGGQTARRAPRLLGRFAAAGHEASVETAAVGTQLSGLLESPRTELAARELVDEIANWIVTVGVETRCGPPIEELERLRRDVLPQWDVTDDLLDGLEPVRGVLQHNDLGSWNIVADPRNREFTILDWESARSCGLPLWDLWYFLADALRAIDPHRDDDPAASFRRLFRGDAPSSALLFRWTREAVERLGIPTATVGRIATLCWLHHGRSHASRADALALHGSEAAGIRWPAEEYPRIWLEDPCLGAEWSAWQ